ncbi:unnamed protein product [Caenorhabditis auriculariae]|uniref:Core-2/I-Branching enzyme n=1 Tax=Caenorhabditis auriculariae TaxID=2777116 RepID=A0A8S1HMQ2_9PELO|nr:unnamed protein product [Caenorhabditis auriculariae]
MVRYQRLDGGRSSSSTLYIALTVIVTLFLLFYLYQTRSKLGWNFSGEYEEEKSLGYKEILSNLRVDLQEKLSEIEQLQLDLLQLQRNEKIDPSVSKFRRRPENSKVDCKRIFDNDKNYIREVAKNRIKMRPSDILEMNCKAIRRRVVPPVALDSLDFGVAFARIVYKDYELIEDQVRASYHPQNVFCFAIDKKADPKFHKNMISLASCLPNILLLPDEETVDSGGHNVNLAHYNCMKALINKPGWGYLILLQNHDFIIKSVYELVKIYGLLGGANDVELTPAGGDRVDKKFKWDPKSLKLFRNEAGRSQAQLETSMSFAKGAAQASLSRQAVDWMVRTADLTLFIKQMNAGSFGVDEQFVESFQVSKELGMPGHFTDECLKQGKNTDFISRMSRWVYSNANECATKTVRHAICLLGVEDLPTIAGLPNVMINKMMPDFDYAAVDCLNELLYNRTVFKQNDHPLETSYYENMVNVLYHKNRDNPEYKLNCTPSYHKWSMRKYPI